MITRLWALLLVMIWLPSCAQTPRPEEASPTVKLDAVDAKVPEQPQPAPAPPKPPKPSKPPEPKARRWVLSAGKIQGRMPEPKQISEFKDPKSGALTIEKCWHYGRFAIVEMSVSNELGSAEIGIRRPKGRAKDLCALDFRGRVIHLRFIEGQFAGIAAGHVVIDGADASEGLREFQLLSLARGESVYKAWRLPEKPVRIVQQGTRVGLEYYAPIKVRCNLVKEGRSCWSQSLKAAGIKKALPIPDCSSAGEWPLVTASARVEDISAPKLEFIDGAPTCTAAP